MSKVFRRLDVTRDTPAIDESILLLESRVHSLEEEMAIVSNLLLAVTFVAGYFLYKYYVTLSDGQTE